MDVEHMTQGRFPSFSRERELSHDRARERSRWDADRERMEERDIADHTRQSMRGSEQARRALERERARDDLSRQSERASDDQALARERRDGQGAAGADDAGLAEALLLLDAQAQALAGAEAGLARVSDELARNGTLAARVADADIIAGLDGLAGDLARSRSVLGEVRALVAKHRGP